MGTKGLNSRYIGILGRFYLSPAFRIVPWEGDKRGQNDAKALCMGGLRGQILSQDLYVILFLSIGQKRRIMIKYKMEDEEMVRIDVNVSDSTKNRLVQYAKERGISQGDVVEDALKNFFERLDRKHSAPDLVLDRMNTLIMSVMQLNMATGQILDKLDQMGGED